jgi:hypothetical protein
MDVLLLVIKGDEMSKFVLWFAVVAAVVNVISLINCIAFAIYIM